MGRTRRPFFLACLTILGALVLSHAVEAQTTGGRTPVRRSRYGAILDRGVHVLNERTLESLEYLSEDGSTLRFRGFPWQLRWVRGGDVIVAGVSAATPSGLLRRVSRISRQGWQLVLETEPATMEDVLWLGRAQESFQMSATDVRQVRIRAGGIHVRGLRPDGGIASMRELQGLSPQDPAQDLVWTPEPIEMELFDVVLFDLDEDPSTTDDQVKVNGLVGIQPSFDLEFDVRWGRLHKLRFANANDLYSTLELKGQVFVPLLDEQITIATFQFSPIVIMIGPVPLVLTPVLDIQAGAIANLSADIETSVTAKISVSGEVIYENGQWRASSELPDGIDDIELEWKSPRLSAEAYAQAYTGPRLSVLVYGVLGPFAEVQGYSELSAQVLPDDFWVLYLGVRGNVGLANDIPIFGPSITIPVFDRKWKIAEGSLFP